MLQHLKNVQKLGGGQVTVGAFMRKAVGNATTSSESPEEEDPRQGEVTESDLEAVGTLGQVRSITWSEESGNLQVCTALRHRSM